MLGRMVRLVVDSDVLIFMVWLVDVVGVVVVTSIVSILFTVSRIVVVNVVMVAFVALCRRMVGFGWLGMFELIVFEVDVIWVEVVVASVWQVVGLVGIVAYEVDLVWVEVDAVVVVHWIILGWLEVVLRSLWVAVTTICGCLVGVCVLLVSVCYVVVVSVGYWLFVLGLVGRCIGCDVSGYLNGMFFEVALCLLLFVFGYWLCVDVVYGFEWLVCAYV